MNAYNEERGNWNALRFIATYGIKIYIDGGIRHGFFKNYEEGLKSIDEMLEWLSSQDEFEWCQALSQAKTNFVSTINLSTSEDS